MSELKNPVTIKKSIGSVVGAKKFYTAKSVVLNTFYGEVIIASSDEDAIRNVSDIIMPPSFKININAAQTIAIFDAKYVTSADAHDKLTEQVKMLRDALVAMVKMVDDDLLSDCDDNHASMVFGMAEKALEETE